MRDVIGCDMVRRRRFGRAIRAAIVLAALAGCGPPMQWTKPNATLAQMQADSAECADLARDHAFRERFFGYSSFGYVPWSPYGHPWAPYDRLYNPYRDPFMWRAQRESELQSFCLRARGYRLTPIEPS